MYKEQLIGQFYRNNTAMFLNSLSKKIKGRKGRKPLQYYEQGMESKGRMFYSAWAESEMVSIGKCEH